MNINPVILFVKVFYIYCFLYYKLLTKKASLILNTTHLLILIFLFYKVCIYFRKLFLTHGELKYFLYLLYILI